MLEEQLFKPVKELFENEGFLVDGEVGKIDVLCVKDDINVAIELKKDLNLKVITQAAQRQKTMDIVYIATFSPKSLHNRQYKDKLYLLKRLGIGLIIVTPRTLNATVIQDPVVSDITNYQTRNKKRRDRIINEMHNRRLHNNTGGVNKRQIMTGYREDCLLVLDAARDSDSISGKAIKDKTGVKKATNIMYNNFYGWFDKVDKGQYRINEKGKQALVQYNETISKLKEKNVMPETTDLNSFMEVIANYPNEVQVLALKLREHILEIYPEAYEKIWIKQKTCGYGIGPKKNSEHFCYMVFAKKHINFGFNYGAVLDDPAGLLGGTGKMYRNVKIREESEIYSKDLEKLIKTAIRDRKEFKKNK